jgi:hypothetical protein
MMAKITPRNEAYGFFEQQILSHCSHVMRHLARVLVLDLTNASPEEVKQKSKLHMRIGKILNIGGNKV